jgi:hypothetical protein
LLLIYIDTEYVSLLSFETSMIFYVVSHFKVHNAAFSRPRNHRLHNLRLNIIMEALANDVTDNPYVGYLLLHYSGLSFNLNDLCTPITSD